MPENLDLVRSICAPWARGDYGGAEWAHPEIELVVVDGPVPGVWRGLAEMGEGSRAVLGPWEDLRVDVKLYSTLGDEYIIGVVQGTVRGATGEPQRLHVSTSSAILFRVQDGKVVRLVVYWDAARVLGQVGLEGYVMSLEKVKTLERVLATLRYTTPEELTDELLAELFAPGVEWLPVAQELRLADRYEGYDGMRRFFTDFLGIWDEFDAHVEGLQEIGDHVVTTLGVTGHQDGPSLNGSWSALWTIENGRVVRMEGFASPGGASEALGLRE